MNQPLVSIVSINYNTPEVTAAMLESLAQLDYPNWEVIVVDNASPKFSSSVLTEKYPFMRHVSSPVNLGFAGGNNLGLHYAKGEYILFLNNDTEVTPTLISGLVEYMQQHPECGISCPKIKYYSLPGTIQYAGTVGLHPLTSRSYNIGYLEQDNGQFDETRKTDQPNGAAMMIPTRLLKEVGPMSEMFFLYYEELDWAARFKEKGYEVHYVGTTEIVHKESVSTGINSAFKTFYLYRNRLLYIRRNYSGVRFYVAATFFKFFSTPFHIIRHGMRKEWGHSKSIWNALMWNYKNKAHREPEIRSTTIAKSLGIL